MIEELAKDIRGFHDCDLEVLLSTCRFLIIFVEINAQIFTAAYLMRFKYFRYMICEIGRLLFVSDITKYFGKQYFISLLRGYEEVTVAANRLTEE